MAPQIAYIGLGNMGQAMCKNLVQKGNLDKSLIVYNRTSKKAIDLAKRIGGCTIANSIQEAVERSDIIFSCLTDDDAVDAAFDIALKADIKGKLFVNCSTTEPKSSNALAERIEAAGGGIVTMPVFGEPSMAEAGMLTCVPAGIPELVQKVLPYCTGVIGRAVIDFSGEEHGKASLLKVIGNVFILNMIETVAEGHVLAEKTGLGHANLQKFISAIFPGPFFLYSKRMVSGDYYNREEPVVAIDMAIHLAGQVLGLAAGCGAKLKAYEVVNEHMKMVRTHAGSKGDISGIYGAIRQESGLPFECKELS